MSLGQTLETRHSKKPFVNTMVCIRVELKNLSENGLKLTIQIYSNSSHRRLQIRRSDNVIQPLTFLSVQSSEK